MGNSTGRNDTGSSSLPAAHSACDHQAGMQERCYMPHSNLLRYYLGRQPNTKLRCAPGRASSRTTRTPTPRTALPLPRRLPSATHRQHAHGMAGNDGGVRCGCSPRRASRAGALMKVRLSLLASLTMVKREEATWQSFCCLAGCISPAAGGRLARWRQLHDRGGVTANCVMTRRVLCCAAEIAEASSGVGGTPPRVG